MDNYDLLFNMYEENKNEDYNGFIETILAIKETIDLTSGKSPNLEKIQKFFEQNKSL